MPHVDACERKHLKSNGTLPPRPAELSGPLPSTPQAAKAFNASMQEAHSLVQCTCPNCARSFSPDAFTRHRKLCTKDNTLHGYQTEPKKPPARTQSHSVEQSYLHT